MIKLIVLLVLSGLAAFGQTVQAHQVGLSWTDTLNPNGTAYNVYRSAGACGSLPISGPSLAAGTGITAMTFTDSTVAVGTWCYAVTAVVSGIESMQSNKAVGSVLPAPPNALTVVVIK